MGVRPDGTHAFGVRRPASLLRAGEEPIEVIPATGYAIADHGNGARLALSNEYGQIVAEFAEGEWDEVLTSLPDDQDFDEGPTARDAS